MASPDRVFGGRFDQELGSVAVALDIVVPARTGFSARMSIRGAPGTSHVVSTISTRATESRDRPRSGLVALLAAERPQDFSSRLGCGLALALLPLREGST